MIHLYRSMRPRSLRRILYETTAACHTKSQRRRHILCSLFARAYNPPFFESLRSACRALLCLLGLPPVGQVVFPARQNSQPPERFVVVDGNGEFAVLSLYSVSARAVRLTDAMSGVNLSLLRVLTVDAVLVRPGTEFENRRKCNAIINPHVD